jgi:hypothetical protein
MSASETCIFRNRSGRILYNEAVDLCCCFDRPRVALRLQYQTGHAISHLDPVGSIPSK